jgi:hypothetical protein
MDESGATGVAPVVVRGPVLGVVAGGFWVTLGVVSVVGPASTRNASVLVLGVVVALIAGTIGVQNTLMSSSLVEVHSDQVRIRNGLSRHSVPVASVMSVQWRMRELEWASSQILVRLWTGRRYACGVLSMADGSEIEMIATEVLEETYKPVLVSQNETVAGEKLSRLSAAIGLTTE